VSRTPEELTRRTANVAYCNDERYSQAGEDFRTAPLLAQATSGHAADWVSHQVACARHREMMVPAQSGDRELHARYGAELRFCDAAVDETDGAVKTQRVRIGGHLQPLYIPCSQGIYDAVD